MAFCIGKLGAFNERNTTAKGPPAATDEGLFQWALTQG